MRVGKEEGLAAKLESLMEACNDMNLKNPVPVPIPVESLEVVLPRLDNQVSPTPVPAKRKRASDLSPNVQKPCKVYSRNMLFPPTIRLLIHVTCPKVKSPYYCVIYLNRNLTRYAMRITGEYQIIDFHS